MSWIWVILVIDLTKQFLIHSHDFMSNSLAYGFKVGSFTLSVISDGCFDIAPLSRFSPNADQATLENTLKTHFLPTDKVTLPINILTIDSGQRRVLIDCGSGHSFVEGTGLFSESSAAVNPLEIDAIALSHAHPDHVGGLIAPDNQPRFPNATCFIDQKEWQFWTDPTLTLPQDQHSLITTARAALSLIDNNTEKLSTQTEILPGITMLPSYGHTPGHHSVLIESDGESLLCVGDMFPHPLTSFAYPDWRFGFDIDPDQAIALENSTWIGPRTTASGSSGTIFLIQASDTLSVARTRIGGSLNRGINHSKKIVFSESFMLL